MRNCYYAVHDDDDSWHPHFLKRFGRLPGRVISEAGAALPPAARSSASTCADGTCIEIEREVLLKRHEKRTKTRCA